VVQRKEPVEAEPLPDAQVCRPGPTFADAVAEVRGVETQERDVEERTRIVQAVGEALAEEAAEAQERFALDFEGSGTRGRNAVSAPSDAVDAEAEQDDGGGGRDEVVVRHRFGSRSGLENARRVVRLRSLRTARTRNKGEGSTSGGGSDPP
jgi:hypothetical protein